MQKAVMCSCNVPVIKTKEVKNRITCRCPKCHNWADIKEEKKK